MSCFYTFLEWDTDDVLQWLSSQGLEAFRSGFQGESFYLLFKIESLHEKILTEKKKLNKSLLVKKVKALNLNMHKKASCHKKDDSALTDARKHELIHRLAFLAFSAEKKNSYLLNRLNHLPLSRFTTNIHIHLNLPHVQ